MENFILPIQVRWSDIDQNRHLRHSAYYDFGATARIALFSEQGLTNAKLEEFHIGPILFREEAIFKKEIKFEDNLTIDIHMTKALPDFSRWSLRHQLYKEGNVLAAVITMDAAWIDIIKRKLAIPDPYIQKIFENFPRAAEFSWSDPSTRPRSSYTPLPGERGRGEG